MSKIRKKIDISVDNEFLASYYYHKAKYAISRDKIYDDFKNEIYHIIKVEAESGHFRTTIALKVDHDRTFDFNYENYKDIFDRLISELLLNGFKITRKHNYIVVIWDSIK